MSSRWPDFFIVGAPKAGTTALHSALARHPGLRAERGQGAEVLHVRRRPAAAVPGPGDAHSRREWVWRRDHYLALFADAPPDVLVGESTPLYLDDPAALLRIQTVKPDAKLIAVIRDPVDRAYSNWMHLWSDGLEPESDFVTAVAMEDARRRRGWAPFWRYRSLGLYGQPAAHARTLFAAEQIHVLRYRDLVEAPRADPRARSGTSSACRPARCPRCRGTTSGRSSPTPSAAGPSPVRFAPAPGRVARPARDVARRRAADARRRCTAGASGVRRSTPSSASRSRATSSTTSSCSSELTGRDFSDWRGEIGRRRLRHPGSLRAS